ncbi:MAG TPA: MerR family transcriptional regulator [Chloroflexota bacterium]|nr:MerR family transcriptional regulator [Chloroflexota bacterium]
MIGVVARLVNMHPQTLRYYEKLGLIQPSRTDGRIRLFSMQDVERLHKIQQLQDDGVNPAGIKKILELSDRIEELEAELDELRKKVPSAL